MRRAEQGGVAFLVADPVVEVVLPVLHGVQHPATQIGSAKLIQHLADTPEGGHRVSAVMAHNVGCAAMDRLKHGGEAMLGIQVSSRCQPHAASDSRAQISEDVATHEAEMAAALDTQRKLTREVHHRVKNNLQLISSIMNIQIRSAKSGEAKALLKALQERMMSLATVHRELYQTSGLADVRARELLPDIVRQIMAISAGPEKPFDVDIDIDDLRLIPLSGDVAAVRDLGGRIESHVTPPRQLARQPDVQPLPV